MSQKSFDKQTDQLGLNYSNAENYTILGSQPFTQNTKRKRDSMLACHCCVEFSYI